jgi:hypothetical protein
LKLNWEDWPLITLIAAAGCVAIYANLERVLRRAARERQHDMEQQLNTMATTIKVLQARVVELSNLQAERTQEAEAVSISAVAEGAGEQNTDPVKPEVVATLTAAATAFLGKQARVRSAQSLPSAQESAGAWARQGRVIVQTSHNVRPKR